MSLPPDDRQHPDRTARTPNGPRHGLPPTGPAGQATAGVTPGSTFAPVSLRPAVDVDAVQQRLRQLGQTRSTDALAERAELLRLLGRLDEALTVAEEAFRLTMFTGDRADAVTARIRRAHVLHDLGRSERAVSEAALARDTASIEEWPELEGAAAELEGWSLYELSRYDEAETALTRAYEAFRAAGAPADRTQALRTAIDEAMRVVPRRPTAATPDTRRSARDAAVRTDEPVGRPRRRVLGAPDAARTDDDQDPFATRRQQRDATHRDATHRDTAQRDATSRADHAARPERPDGSRVGQPAADDRRPRGLWGRGGTPRDGGDHRR